MFLNIDQKNPADIAAIDDHEDSLTYGELVRFCDHFGEVLGKRTLIFILSENCIGAFAGYIGALSNKIVPLIIHSHTESGLFQNLLSAYRPEYLWLPEHLGHEYGSEVVFGFKHYILVKTGMTPPPLYKELSLLLPTSGSTGSSKLVRHSYKNVEANARNVSLLFGLDKHERALATLPIYYTMGLSVISSHIYAGATILLTGKSLTDGKFWTFMKEHRATSFTGVPYSFEVLQKLRFFRMDLPHLQLITPGGGKMDEKLFRTCADYAEKNGKKFIATYGQTEGTARMAYLPAHLASSKICSIGRAIPNGELSLVDEQGKLILEKEATGQLVY
ncbi:MAG: AMP-binding protein, partial [Odoribacter splanchnicus]